MNTFKSEINTRLIGKFDTLASVENMAHNIELLNTVYFLEMLSTQQPNLIRKDLPEYLQLKLTHLSTKYPFISECFDIASLKDMLLVECKGLPNSVFNKNEMLDSESLRTVVHALIREISEKFNHLEVQLPYVKEQLTRLQTELDPNSSVLPTISSIQKQLDIFGFFRTSGQGRLDSKQVLKALKGMPGCEAFPNDLLPEYQFKFLSDKLAHAVTPSCQETMSSPSFPRDDNGDRGAAKNALDYFEMRSALYIPIMKQNLISDMIIANYGQPSHFLAFFYMALQAGSITIQDGKVVSSDINIVPLVEDVDSFRKFPEQLEILLEDPLILSYFKNRLEGISVMWACSDTTRSDGMSASTEVLMTTPQKLLKIAKKYGIKINFEDGRGSRYARNGGVVDTFWQQSKPPSERYACPH